MAITNVRGRQLKDDDVFREDLNISVSGKAVITKVIPGTNIAISSTGVDAGTGDVTVNVTGVATITPGTVNVLPKYTSGTGLGPSTIEDNGTRVLIPIDTRINGNVSINVAAGAWNTSYRALQIGGSLSLWGSNNTDGFIDLSSNVLFNGSSNCVRLNTGFASDYYQQNGQHVWRTAVSAAAASAITFTTAMLLNANGNLGIGTTAPLSRIHARVAGTINTQTTILHLTDTSSGTSNGAAIDFSYSSGNILNARIGAVSVSGGGASLTFGTAASDGAAITNHVFITKLGNVLVGTGTDNGARLQVNGTGVFTGNVTAPNFQDATGVYNVNLGGAQGRGIAAGYSGGNYGGLGFNVRHTTTANQWIAPTSDTVSYLMLHNGLSIHYAPTGTSGRTLTTTGMPLVFRVDGPTGTVHAAKYINTTSSTFSAFTGDGQFQIFSSTLSGVVITGRGSTNDINLANRNGANVLTIPTGTINVVVAGELSAGATTVSTSTTTGALRSAGGLGVAGAGWFGSHVNTAGRFTSTLANDTATGGGQIFLNGDTGNRIDYAAVGIAAPSFTTRSVGTKIVLFPAISATNTDYAMGIESASMWFSVPENISGRFFRWYAGTTNIATLTGTGQLGIGVTSVVASARLQVDSTTQGVLLTPMTQAQRLAIASPANGLIVTQTDGTSPGLWLFISGTWRAIALI